MPLPIGRSLHIGINKVSGGHYNGFTGALMGCENDARFMAQLATDRSFSTVVTLLGPNATSTAALAEIKLAAASLPSGSFFLLTFAGHGAYIPNEENATEIERFDQTWALYDRQLIDDELSALWPCFDKGVRILVMVDACHSGTPLTDLTKSRNSGTGSPVRARALPSDVVKATYDEYGTKLYDPIRAAIPAPLTNDIRASVLSITACEDFELAADGDPHGLFTGTIRKLWKQGKFQGSHQNLLQMVAGKLAYEPQHPTWQHAGTLDVDFWQGEAFAI